MPLTPAPSVPLSFFWSFYGHSYYQGSYGAHAPSGRADSIIRSLFGLEQVSQSKNHAAIGAKVTFNGNPQSGWTRLFQNEKGNTVNPGYPDVCSDGAYFLGWGINDLAVNGQTSQCNTAYIHAMRACISRCRAARSWDPGNNTAFSYGAGFTVVNFQWESSSGDTYYSASATTNATISWTIPSNYAGGTITFCLLAQPGAKGATWTFGGTAGVTATVSTSAIMPAGSGAGRTPVVQRITGLTSANASQTITLTVTGIDVGGTADFCGCWIESPWPPPVLVPNTAKMLALGYGQYAASYTVSGLSGTAVSATPVTITLGSGTTIGLSATGSGTMPSGGGTVTISWTGLTNTTLTGVTHSGGGVNYSSNTLSWAGPVDADVTVFNALLPPLLAEFDAMVQLVDLDAAIGQDPVSLGSDGLHPSELGAARIADAFRVSAQRLGYSSLYGEASQMNVPNRAVAPLYLPRLSQGWYTSPGWSGTSGTAYTAVAQDMFAIPFTCTSQAETWVRWSVETLAGTVAATVLMGIYDDRSTSGSPKHLYNAPTATPVTLNTGASVFTSTLTLGANGNLILGPDPGLYWLVLLIVTAGTGVTFRTLKGPTLLMPNLASTGSGVSAVCGWKATTAGTTLPASWPFPFTPALSVQSDNCPVIGIQVN